MAVGRPVGAVSKIQDPEEYVSGPLVAVAVRAGKRSGFEAVGAEGPIFGPQLPSHRYDTDCLRSLPA